MVADMPLSEASMLEVSGVGQQKYQLYGQDFLAEIVAFAKAEQANGAKLKGATYLLTHEMYQQGLTPHEIATQRNLNVVTIYGHLCQMAQQGAKDIDLQSMISESELKLINGALGLLPPVDNALKPVFDYLGGEIDYHKIRIAHTLMLMGE